ncbi:MAG: hypothetical protein IPG51_08145 [Chloroflexi bacterium]|nr:hypothetical protein [Chloroflexota bacterium]
MRKLDHWSPTYLRNRLMLAWDQKTNPMNPWLTNQATKLLNELLQEGDVGFEWGSGRSTVWLAKRVSYLWSVESDLKWFDLVSKWLQTEKLENVTYTFHSVEATEKSDLQHPYVQAINQIQECGLDFGLVDGKYRDACAVSLIPKLRPGGILIVDNVERYLPSSSSSPESIGMNQNPSTKLWTEFADSVLNWRKIWTTNGVTDTCMWFKPCNLR